MDEYRPETVIISEAQTALAAFVGAIKPNGRGDRGTWLNITSSKNPTEREIYTFALSNKWQINDDLHMYTELAKGHGESFNDQMWGTSGVAWNNIPYLAYNFNAGTDIPSLIPYTNGSEEISEDNRLDLTDPLGYALDSTVFFEQHEENSDTAIKVDFDYALEFGVINQLEFGVRLAKRTGERWRNEAKDTKDTDENGILAGMSYQEIETLLPGSTTLMPFTNILDGATGDFPNAWISMNSEYLLDNSTEFKKAIGVNMEFDEGWGFNVEEETKAIYVKANFDGMFDGVGINYSGNFGIRYIETDQLAVGALTGGDGSYTPYSQDNSYNNTLPSFNINFELSDDLYLRLAGAKALARPAIADVAPITNIQFFANSGSTGNTDLVPEIVTQFDASLEWYFNEGGILSAAIFKKNFKDTIEDGFLNRCFFIPPEFIDSSVSNDIDCAADGSEALLGLKSKVNAGDASLKGLEIGYQQSFSQLPSPFDGLGVQANYTFTDSDILQTLTTGFQAPLQDLSRNSYNAVVYYEKYGFSFRMAYNWRDDYYDKLTSTNSAEFAQPYGQLDTSLNYKITPNWTVGLNVTNVTNEAEQKYQEIYERFLAYRVNDTRYALTLRGRL